MRKIIFVVLFFSYLFPVTVYARVTPNDTYQAKREQFEQTLSKISDSAKRQKIEQADQLLYDINQKVCSKFDQDLAKLSAILEELKRREGVTETIVAFGQGETPLDTAAYWLNYAAEAVAYQRIQDYTPQISVSNLSSPTINSMTKLKGDLGTLRGKILRAKAEVKKALDSYEK